MHGSQLRALFSVPEDGIVFDEGNGVVLAGIANIARLLTGDGGYPLSPGTAVFGVGTDGETAFTREMVHLAHAAGEGHGRSFYQKMDAGFPVAAGTVINGQATFGETDACFPWAEWCWATGPGVPVPGPVLRDVYGGDGRHVMLNRKAPENGLGVKDPGVAWVFRTEIGLVDR